MRNESLNPRVMALDDSHAAKRFLSAFIECRSNCVGLELEPGEHVDQEWQSLTDGRLWTFSGFAYAFLSLDIALDDFHQRALSPTDANATWPWDLPRVRSLIHECAQAARQSGNSVVLERVSEVLRMLSLWEEYLKSRQDTMLQADDRK